jgi:peroxiredoxin
MNHTFVRNFLAATAMAVILISCKDKGDGTVNVKVSLKNIPEHQYAYLDLIELDAAEPKTTDTFLITPGDLSFTLKGVAAGNEDMYRLRFDKRQDFALLIGDREDIDITADWKEFAKYTTNSAGSNSVKQLLSTYNQRLNELLPLRSQLDSLTAINAADSLLAPKQEAFNIWVKGMEDFLMGYADTAKSPTVALYAIGLGKGQIDIEKLKPVMLNLARRFADKPKVTNITGQFFAYLQEQEKKEVTGNMAPDFTLPDPSGKNVSLSSFRGKYVLVDFWASWCGPCRQENPNVVDAYQQFKSKNFTILGVSLDKTKDAWIEAIEKDGLDWTHVSDLKFWESSVVPLYQIEGIPFNVLLDPDGKIIASNLRGQALSKKLAEVLK